MGSLVRPPALLELIRGGKVGSPAYEQCLKDSVLDVVRRQVEAGIDIPSDGEFGKNISWSQYALERLSGFERRPVAKEKNPFYSGADRARFPEFYAEMDAQPGGGASAHLAVCVGPIAYTGQAAVQRDVDNFKSALVAAGASQGFLPVAAPASVIPDRRNEYYQSDDACLEAIAAAMRSEYRAIVAAGLFLQLDDARLAVTYDRMVPPASFEDYRSLGGEARRGAQRRARRHPRGARALPRLLGQLARAAHHRRAARGNRRPRAAGARRRLPDRGG